MQTNTLNHAHPLILCLLTDGGAHRLQQFGVPAVGRGDGGGEAGGDPGVVHAQHIRAALQILLAQAVGVILRERQLLSTTEII